MNYFLDTEFMEDGKTVELLSLALVCENGREFYAEVEDADIRMANDWVKANVIPHMWGPPLRQWRHQALAGQVEAFAAAGGAGGLYKKAELGAKVLEFIRAGSGHPQFWGYYADYDWVAFCQLFGKMIDLPKGFPMYCLDLKQLAFHIGNPELPKQTTTEHHALLDARWNRDVHAFLKNSLLESAHFEA